MGMTVARVMTDNDSFYRSHEFVAAGAKLGLKDIHTETYT